MSIVSTILKIYSDPSLTTMVASQAGTTALTQQITVTGLSSSTQYWAVMSATDNNGLTGTSAAFNFTTAAATYIFSAYEVSYENAYDTLFAAFDVDCVGISEFDEVGIEFCTDSHFAGTLITANATNTSSFSNDVSGFSANTTYYWRLYATTQQYGKQYFNPDDNIITTRYAAPILEISADQVTDTTARIAVTYTGDYPATDLTAKYAIRGGSWQTLHVEDSEGTQYLSISGLTPGATYDLEATCAYYDEEVTAEGSFVTFAARPSVTITGSTVTPSSVTLDVTIS